MRANSARLVHDLLEGRYVASLATYGADGSIHLTAMWYLYEDGFVLLATTAGSQKARNVAARPQVGLMIDSRGPGPMRGASTWGSADLLSGEIARRTNDRIWQRYLTGKGLADRRFTRLLEAAEPITIRVRPGRWISWDMGELFQGLLESREHTLPLEG